MVTDGAPSPVALGQPAQRRSSDDVQGVVNQLNDVWDLSFTLASK